ncbi:hypothetical protein BT69DRAFT_1283643 [Atractiella rhizophila]|nr:hypothetical protein BT69DRAFT_1283643 [Atractiella rhizophila]
MPAHRQEIRDTHQSPLLSMHLPDTEAIEQSNAYPSSLLELYFLLATIQSMLDIISAYEAPTVLYMLALL